MWFLLIDKEIEAKEEVSNDYGHKVALGQKYLCGKFLESDLVCRGCRKYKLNTTTALCILLLILRKTLTSKQIMIL